MFGELSCCGEQAIGHVCFDFCNTLVSARFTDAAHHPGNLCCRFTDPQGDLPLFAFPYVFVTDRAAGILHGNGFQRAAAANCDADRRNPSEDRENALAKIASQGPRRRKSRRGRR